MHFFFLSVFVVVAFCSFVFCFVFGPQSSIVAMSGLIRSMKAFSRFLASHSHSIPYLRIHIFSLLFFLLAFAPRKATACDSGYVAISNDQCRSSCSYYQYTCSFYYLNCDSSVNDYQCCKGKTLLNCDQFSCYCEYLGLNGLGIAIVVIASLVFAFSIILCCYVCYKKNKVKEEEERRRQEAVTAAAATESAAYPGTQPSPGKLPHDPSGGAPSQQQPYPPPVYSTPYPQQPPPAHQPYYPPPGQYTQSDYNAYLYPGGQGGGYPPSNMLDPSQQQQQGAPYYPQPQPYGGYQPYPQQQRNNLDVEYDQDGNQVTPKNQSPPPPPPPQR